MAKVFCIGGVHWWIRTGDENPIGPFLNEKKANAMAAVIRSQDHYDAFLKHLEKQSEAKVAAARAEYLQKMEEQKREYEQKVKDLRKSYLQEESRIKGKYEERAEKLKDKYDTRVDELMNNIPEGTRECMDVLKAIYEWGSQTGRLPAYLRNPAYGVLTKLALASD